MRPEEVILVLFPLNNNITEIGKTEMECYSELIRKELINKTRHFNKTTRKKKRKSIKGGAYGQLCN